MTFFEITMAWFLFLCTTGWVTWASHAFPGPPTVSTSHKVLKIVSGGGDPPKTPYAPGQHEKIFCSFEALPAPLSPQNVFLKNLWPPEAKRDIFQFEKL